MAHQARLQRLSVLAALALVPVLASCGTPAPPSPEEKALQQMYQMGCRPEDATGYEHLLEYCDSRE